MLFLLLLLLFRNPIYGDEIELRPRYVSILLYHRFGESKYPSTNISPELFREQLEFLRQENYTVLNLDQFRDLVFNREPFPKKSVLITIDDAYSSIYNYAFPILKEYNFPFTLFVDVRPLSSGATGAMTWEMLKKMMEWGATVGNHTYTHGRIGRPKSNQTLSQYREWVKSDILLAQKRLNENGIFTDVIAYPYGEYNEVVVDVAREVGFELMFAQDEGAVDSTVDLTRIPRLPIVGGNMDETRFKYKLNLSPLHVSNLVPSAIEMTTNPPPYFSLRIVDPSRYRPGVVNAFFSEVGRLDISYDGKSGEIKSVIESPFERQINRLIVTAREKNSPHFSMFSRLYVRPLVELGLIPDSLDIKK
ncbi:MAG: polysaccharide deacetylase family protein [Candidatus Latescibacterota bacterium]|nr:polysaccharide deacetylase family protein [Candidatus Latescibacterota bacterium]